MVHTPFSANHPGDAGLQAELDAIVGMSLDDLRVSFRRLTRKTAPPGLPRWLLQRIIAYRIQAAVLGDLDAGTRNYLDQVGKAVEAERRSREKATRAGRVTGKRLAVAMPSLTPQPRYRPGTQFVREHAGVMHRVTVLAEGYEWNGNTYRSLSEIARAITGTVWNGPAFFGLRPQKPRGKPLGDADRSMDAGAAP